VTKPQSTHHPRTTLAAAAGRRRYTLRVADRAGVQIFEATNRVALAANRDAKAEVALAFLAFCEERSGVTWTAEHHHHHHHAEGGGQQRLAGRGQQQQQQQQQQQGMTRGMAHDLVKQCNSVLCGTTFVKEARERGFEHWLSVLGSVAVGSNPAIAAAVRFEYGSFRGFFQAHRCQFRTPGYCSPEAVSHTR